MTKKYNFEVSEDKLWLKSLTLDSGVVIEIKNKGLDIPRGHRVVLTADNEAIEEISTGSEEFIMHFGENKSLTQAETFSQLQKWANFVIEKHSIDN